MLGITCLMLGLGLVMVQSTAPPVQDLSYHMSPYADLTKQLAGLRGRHSGDVDRGQVQAAAVPRAAAYPALAVAIVGLCLTLIHGVGVSANGAARWISIGGQQLQPSELAKLALVLWGRGSAGRQGQARPARRLGGTCWCR